jgi:hypothetical protein
MPHTMDIVFTDNNRKTVLMDSISYISPENRDDIIISGSHGGTSSAGYAIEARVAAAFFNDAGGGKNGAGIRGLHELEKHSIIAIAVSHESAEIANSAETYACGIISHVNGIGKKAGISTGMRVTEAVDILRSFFKPHTS